MRNLLVIHIVSVCNENSAVSVSPFCTLSLTWVVNMGTSSKMCKRYFVPTPLWELSRLFQHKVVKNPFCYQLD